MNNIRNIILTVMIVILSALSVTACGEKEITGVTGKTLSKEGALEAVIVTDFDENLYSVTELEEMMTKEISEYSRVPGNNDAVNKIESVKCEDGVLTAVMGYASVADYAAFNRRTLTVESFDKAIADGDIKVSLHDVNDGAAVEVKALTDTDKLDMLITDETGYITLPGKVKYLSSGVENVTAKQVNVTEEMDGLAYIVYSRK